MVTRARPALELPPKEKKAVREFMTAVQTAYGNKIHRAALFGSKVRGESTRYSDIDVLLIVSDDNWKFRKAISGISSDIALKYDVLLDVRIISVSRWQYMADIQSGLYKNISRDAVPIKIRRNKQAGASNRRTSQ
ncbi:MAG TPA: nucleotidyltransferase domain-containing protein [Anaerolineales bacterium]|nr:nucleotidyltransferase domain-containing protein [Anaerolineales bacterium]